jgi:hypothetical protein
LIELVRGGLVVARSERIIEEDGFLDVTKGGSLRPANVPWRRARRT